MTSSGSKSQFVTSGGFAQSVQNPNNFASQKQAAFNSSQQTLIIPLVFGTTEYTAYLPQGAFISELAFIATTAFTAGATLEISSLDPQATVSGGAPVVTNVGTAGSSSFSYKVVAQAANGNFSLATSAGTTSTGNAVLSGTNYNSLAITAAAGAKQYAIYRTAAPAGYQIGLIGYTTSLVYTDTGALVIPNTLVPAAAGDIAASFQVQTYNQPSILQPMPQSPIQLVAGQAIGVQQVVVTFTGTTALVGAGYLVISYSNTLNAPSQI